MLILTRRCYACKEHKPLLAFTPSSLRASEYRCRDCHRPAALASYHRAMQDPEKRKRLAERAKCRRRNQRCGWVLRSMMRDVRNRESQPRSER